MRSVRSSCIERCICAMPASAPRVQTLVATKAFSRLFAASRRVPVTASAWPYIGELSTTDPPAANSAFSTAESSPRSAPSGRTSKPR
jgi:hypothetical protein